MPSPLSILFWKWDDLVSASVILLYAVPWIRYAITWDLQELRAFWGMIGTVALNESLKHFVIGKASPRPAQATNCNLWANDGPQGGRPGMPSGHSAHVSFFTGYYLQTLSPSPWTYLLVAYALLVMFSRWTKCCHSLPQILSGSALGLLLSALVVRHL
jgi:membrane-associated phospholipid phosphatase